MLKPENFKVKKKTAPFAAKSHIRPICHSRRDSFRTMTFRCSRLWQFVFIERVHTDERRNSREKKREKKNFEIFVELAKTNHEMGAQGSTPRTVHLDNDIPIGVIDVSDDVVQRLKGLNAQGLFHRINLNFIEIPKSFGVYVIVFAFDAIRVRINSTPRIFIIFRFLFLFNDFLGRIICGRCRMD